MANITRFQIILSIIFIVFTVWISAKEIRDDQWIYSDSNMTHWINCTINGTIYYDDDCVGWFSQLILWMGGILFTITLLCCCCLCYCCCTLLRICCCSERPRDVIYATYVYPTPYNNPYTQIS